MLSALLWRGTPHRVFEAARHREQVELFTSAALLEELAEVLIRPAPAKRLAAIGRTARQVLADYVDAVDLVTPLAVPSVITADPDDDHVIAAAVAAEADLVVSGDRHLLALGAHQTIHIVTPSEALARISG
ncbi:MAG TPA: putative toxin-antitoxin system toxin component, PIN family [Stellaceae bacterium]|nr:putative toxin-antitoxin system toxin component, PIN family [Stellaceae bacterium]